MDESIAKEEPGQNIRAGYILLPCRDLQATLDFFVERLGLRLDRISPADDPRHAWLSGYGLQLELRRGSTLSKETLRLSCVDVDALGAGESTLVAPNGTRIELVPAAPALDIPEGLQEFSLSRAGDESAWISGRAGMRYRDLIPNRLGGRFIASHIQIPDAGPVPDAVHFHAIRFQMIYCAQGWVRVVYEDQGEPFVLHAGDCVLQPPRIRHRVLESSAGLEVVEIACPAEHDTFLDHELELPTPDVLPNRDFGGQRFVRHVASAATWQPWTHAGFECRDLGMAAATGMLAGAQVVRMLEQSAAAQTLHHAGEFRFLYLLRGELQLQPAGGAEQRLRSGDSAVLPAGVEFDLAACSADVEFLEIRLPARD